MWKGAACLVGPCGGELMRAEGLRNWGPSITLSRTHAHKNPNLTSHFGDAQLSHTLMAQLINWGSREFLETTENLQQAQQPQERFSFFFYGQISARLSVVFGWRCGSRDTPSVSYRRNPPWNIQSNEKKIYVALNWRRNLISVRFARALCCKVKSKGLGPRRRVTSTSRQPLWFHQTTRAGDQRHNTGQPFQWKPGVSPWNNPLQFDPMSA